MASIQGLIAANVSLEFTEYSRCWTFTPCFRGEEMERYVPDTCHCRALYTFNVGSRRYLMKIDTSRGFLQCPDELHIWNALLKEHKRYFVPIMHGNDGADGSPPYTISPWVPNLACMGDKWDYSVPHQYESMQGIVNEISETYRLRDLTFNKNWYIRNGRPLIVDYGCTR